jgi:basic membrane protein A
VRSADSGRIGAERTGQSRWGMKEAAVDLVGVPDDSVPAAPCARVDEVRHGLRTGSFHIWRGPLMDNRGRQVLGPQQLADDTFLRSMAFYVKGVEGQLPS